MGACGVLSLLLRLLQTGSDEEKSQAASGLWILSFRDENKALLRDEPLFFEGNQRVVLVNGYLHWRFSQLT